MNKKIYLLMLLIFFTACTPTVPATPQLMENSTISPAATIPLPTWTPTTPVATPTVETLRSETSFITECLNITADTSIEMFAKGIVLASDRHRTVVVSDNHSGFVPLLNPADEEVIGEIRVSPDRTKLAYVQINLDENRNIVSEVLNIISFDGSRQQTVPWGAYNSSFDWIDNSNIITYRQSPDQEIPLPLVVVNLTTGNVQELSLSADDLNYYDNIDWGMYYSSRSVYDPTLSKVIYLGGYGFDAVLQDHETGQELARVEYGGYFTPEWSLDGSQVLIVKALDDRWPRPYELFSISRDGEIEQLTYISNYFEYTEIRSYVWSPNGEFIAFWLNTSQSRDQIDPYDHLSILDLRTGTTTDYCISTASNDYAFPPVWSPDGQHLMVRTQHPRDTGLNQIILIDISEGLAVQIAEDMEPVGWMANP